MKKIFLGLISLVLLFSGCAAKNEPISTSIKQNKKLTYTSSYYR